jgi:LmbE family N-acetylglucosaminyl deacetylase
MGRMTAEAPAVPNPLEPLDENWQRGLAIVAHPDDLEFGAAAAIARWTAQGKEIVYCLLTSGEAGIDGIDPAEAGPLREEEQRESARIVGVSQVDFLGLPDGMLEYGVPLRREITRVIRKYKPEIVITGSFRDSWDPEGQNLNMSDHIVTGRAVLDAARDAGNRWIFPELIDEGLEPWGGVRFVAYAGAERPTHGVDVTGEPLRRGILSLAAHAEYTKGLGAAGFDPAPFLTWMAEQGGRAVGVESAVLFDVFELIPAGPPPWLA